MKTRKKNKKSSNKTKKVYRKKDYSSSEEC